MKFLLCRDQLVSSIKFVLLMIGLVLVFNEKKPTFKRNLFVFHIVLLLSHNIFEKI